MGLHQGLTAIVTGSASGIGKATVQRLLDEGAYVLCVDQHTNEQLDHDHAFNLAIDVAEDNAAETITAAAIAQFGSIDFVVNNAGMVGGSSIESMDTQIWDRIMSVNLHAVFKLSKAAIPFMKASQRGRIINIGSVMSTLAGAAMGAYTSSKHAIAGLTKTLALELGEYGITANYIQPGAIITGITQPAIESDPQFSEFWINKSPLKRLGKPEDIANAINFLLSKDASFITGHGLVVDGGVMRQA
ncbi:MAG: SDR family oxidoreductase [Gammaproteobacteria bacterium]|jgi:NAD(P)-dependent dehydrogenase (short-subunit alcohol dehydrogenase family)|nr:SDR family oxidoreductase [Gammaproteobacteria bacterium]MBT5602944.1 SDR family oxidoreductase [Gammaproteobacteria bacterium]MBT6245419.1 SDR family oxidoreductase [Gammaproteobacteria bacterium]